MRRFALLALSLAATQAFALGFSQKDTLTNTRYQESPEEVAAREFKEHKAELPPLPDTQSGDWFDLYVNETYGKQPKILLSSLQIMPAPDNSIRYVLNVRSDKGYDNLSVEGLYCARTSFTYSNDKRSSYKVFAYGDTVNHRWIEPRKGDWKLIRQCVQPQRCPAHRPVSGILYRRHADNGRRLGTTFERTRRPSRHNADQPRQINRFNQQKGRLKFFRRPCLSRLLRICDTGPQKRLFVQYRLCWPQSDGFYCRLSDTPVGH